MSAKRRLAAIMFTDIVGYTALMGKDEGKAIKILEENRQIHKKYIKLFHGWWIKEMGDGILVSFDSISNAISCALFIQKACIEKDIQLKVGIHEGEIVFGGKDVLGDGVNIASRIQEISEPGSVTISARAYENIKNRPEYRAVFLTERKLKNVEAPVRIYSVTSEGELLIPEVIETLPFLKKKYVHYTIAGVVIIIVSIFLWQFLFPKTSTENSIIILPFSNESVDKENEHWVNGVTEDIRNTLSMISDIRVASRVSSEKFRNTFMTAREIADELDVDYILEGTVAKHGDQIRIHVQLIEAYEDRHIWADTYNLDISEEMKDYFEAQAGIAEEVVFAMKANISPEENKRIKKIGTNNKKAYDAFLQGRDTVWREGSLYALKCYDRALELDPDFSSALAAKGEVLIWKGKFDSAYYYFDKALELDPETSLVYLIRGSFYFFGWYGQGNDSLAFEDLKKCRELEPNSAEGMLYLGNLYIRYKNDVEKGFQYLDQIYRISEKENAGKVGA